MIMLLRIAPYQILKNVFNILNKYPKRSEKQQNILLYAGMHVSSQ